jgi:poly(3-hydroxybutyrate) depolymerase
VVGDKPAGHGMITADAGNACSVTAAPYINDCDYDAAGELLAHLLGKLHAGKAVASSVIGFDQTPFGGHDISMAEEGYVYIPQVCRSERCRVHVAFHPRHRGAVRARGRL